MADIRVRAVVDMRFLDERAARIEGKFLDCTSGERIGFGTLSLRREGVVDTFEITLSMARLTREARTTIETKLLNLWKNKDTCRIVSQGGSAAAVSASRQVRADDGPPQIGPLAE
jgi:hypothetical protein